MSAHSLGRNAAVRSLRRFIRTPKGLLLLVLIGLILLAAPGVGYQLAFRSVAAATATAAAIDLIVVRLLRGRWTFPDGAILSGLIIAMVLSPQEPPFVPILAAACAIAGKRLIRVGAVNVFNPAAFGLVLAAVAYPSGHSWWGALPELAAPGIVILAAFGLFMVDRLNKIPLTMAFLGAYFGIFAVAAAIGTASDFADIFRGADVHAALFFAFFMLDDPPTSPVRYRRQLLFAAAIALASFSIFEFLGVVYFLPAALLVGNALEALARNNRRRVRALTRPLPLPAHS